jgi:hypothetical protein
LTLQGEINHVYRKVRRYSTVVAVQYRRREVALAFKVAAVIAAGMTSLLLAAAATV